MFNLFAPQTEVIVETDGVKQTITGEKLRLTIYSLNAFKRNYTLTYLNDGSQVIVEFKNSYYQQKKELENEISKYKNQLQALENIQFIKSKEKFDIQKIYQKEIATRETQIKNIDAM